MLKYHADKRQAKLVVSDRPVFVVFGIFHHHHHQKVFWEETHTLHGPKTRFVIYSLRYMC